MYRLDQAATELALQETYDAANLLQRKTALAEFADDSYFGQVVERIDALVSLAGGNNNASLIPPLQLTKADAGQLHYVTGCKGLLQIKDPETIVSANV
jgi:hypothetical protein